MSNELHGAKWDMKRLLEEAARRGWGARAGTSIPTADGEYKHPIRLSINSDDLLDFVTALSTPPTKEGQGQGGDDLTEYAKAMNRAMIEGGMVKVTYISREEMLAPPSPVPAEPTVVTMPPTEHCRYRVSWGDGDTVIVDAAGQRDVIETIHYLSVETAQAYADARVAEGTRELVDGLRFQRESGESYEVKQRHARALIAKYTQTQKESK
jgi:hypothetical protein